MKTSELYYSGASGLCLPVPNKSLYPPEFQNSSRLRYYGHLFNSIEINSSFYKVPQQRTVAKWAEEVPAGFKFTYKLWREITHAKNLQFNAEDVPRFLEAIDPAGDKKGCLLVQFPPGLDRSTFPRIHMLLDLIRNADTEKSWRLFLEFRKSHWYSEKLFRLLDSYSAGLVIHDKAGAVASFDEFESDSVYLRLHGPEGNYRGSYDDDILYEYSSYIRAWMEEGKEVYTYFNNTMGDAVQNLITLNGYVRS